jgi:hypothetical protein
MKKILVVGIIALLTGLILTKSISAVVLTSKPELYKQKNVISEIGLKFKKVVFEKIKYTKDKYLVLDEVIGDRKVRYWEHVVDNIFIKNDSMLLHMDLYNHRVLEFKRCWSNIEVTSIEFKNSEFQDNYIWKRKVVFPDKDDCNIYYSFYFEQEYPLFCWEVRYSNGSTIIYDINETPIGHGISAPSSKGFLVQGFGDSKWRYWRENAQKWYRKWYKSVNCISNPNISQISYYIKNESTNTDAFYVIAHSGGLSSRFLANKNSYYTANQLHHDMDNRSPMKLAILCCCSSMNYIGPGSLSYEFRKGKMNDTVTIGYHSMDTCPEWYKSLEWQDFMFKNIDKGYTVKKAYERACAEYPHISDYVRFIGDPNLKINNNNTSVTIRNSKNEFYNFLFYHWRNEICFLNNINCFLITGISMSDHTYSRIRFKNSSYSFIGFSSSITNNNHSSMC